jgi:hypothetical protein
MIEDLEEEIKRRFNLRSAKAIGGGEVLVNIINANYDKQREAETINLKGAIN